MVIGFEVPKPVGLNNVGNFNSTTLATTVDDAVDLVATVRETGRVFAVAHLYAGYPTSRDARALLARGELGALRVIQVEYAQNRLAGPPPDADDQAAMDVWRADLQRVAGGLEAIGSHATHLVEFVTGLHPTHISADLATYTAGRSEEDNAHLLFRYEGGVRGMLWVSQVATGVENGLTLRIFGEKAAIALHQEQPNHLWLLPHGEPPRLLTRAGPPNMPTARIDGVRTPAGHPEEYLLEGPDIGLAILG